MSPKMALLRPICAAFVLALIPATASAQDQSLSLDEALRLAGAESPVASIAEAEVDIARGNERQAGYGPNPEVSLEVENIAGSGAFSGLRSNETTLMLTQPIELGGKRGARMRAAQAQSSVAELDALIARADLALAVRQRFTEAVAARENLALQQSIYERSAEIYRIASELVEAGREPPLRAIRAEAAMAEAEADLRAAEADYLNARTNLAELWGASTPPETVETFWLTPNTVPSTGDIVGTLTLARAEAELNAAEAGIVRERREAIPDLNVGAGIRRFEETGDTAFTIGASMAIPLRNRNQGGIEAAEANARATEGRLLLLRLQLQRERTTLQTSIAADQARVESLSEIILPRAEEALELAQIGYRYGRFTLIDVLDAASVRDRALAGLISARTDVAQATATLMRLTQRQGGES
uniref:TolC family protein n=1 Tax=uncultured Erythrobacter sp. TaxID=263913 RepID=UPI00260BB8AF|nr:TolC family protein [uncultured Erythrobacter sp.]